MCSDPLEILMSGKLPNVDSEDKNRSIQQIIQQVADKKGFQINFFEGSNANFTIVIKEEPKDCFTEAIIEEITMGDNYSAGQASAMGPNSQAIGNTFQQIWQQSQSNIDLQSLAHELETLRTGMRKEATTPEHDIAIGEVAAAQTAATQGNGAKALEHLKNAGQWAFNVSTKIGIGVAIAAIKTALGT
jgi:hypothetical protein